ncbi:MAG: hydroxyacid dehydrogenase [Candidatus Cloacimonetes bacterium]|nr:hydroxyacid dehydrogenase [Candidatus Cloacimonadota bacterium]
MKQLIKVSGISFSKNHQLRQRLLESFPNSIFTDSKTNLNPKQLINFYKGADAIIVGTENINQNVCENSTHIKALSKYGVGTDNLDFNALLSHHIDVLLNPGTNRISVAELSLSLILGLMHNVFQKGVLLKKGVWEKNGGVQLFQKKVGIIGYGHVGQTLHQFLKPFQCDVYVNDIKNLKDLSLQNKFSIATKQEIYQECDVISLHIPLDPKTKNLINQETLSKMKSNAILINTARGQLVDMSALKYALKTNIIAGAGLDVFPQEPPQDRDFLALENLMVTPHIGGNTKEAQWNMGLAAITQLEKYFNLQ